MACLPDQAALKSQLDALAASSAGQLPLDSGIRNGGVSCNFHSSTIVLICFTVLPDGVTVKSVRRHGQSAWSYTMKIDTVTRDTAVTSYFAKVQSSLASLVIVPFAVPHNQLQLIL